MHIGNDVMGKRVNGNVARFNRCNGQSCRFGYSVELSDSCDVILNDYQSYEDVDLVNIRTNGVVELMDC